MNIINTDYNKRRKTINNPLIENPTKPIPLTQSSIQDVPMQPAMAPQPVQVPMAQTPIQPIPTMAPQTVQTISGGVPGAVPTGGGVPGAVPISGGIAGSPIESTKNLSPEQIQQLYSQFQLTDTGPGNDAFGRFSAQLAQQMAAEGLDSQTMNMITTLTNQLLQDPNYGYDPTEAANAAMDLFNKDRAKAFEAARQATGGIAGYGGRIEDLTSQQLETQEQRGLLGAKLQQEAADKKRQNLFEALAQGIETVGKEQNLRNDQINNLINAAGIGLGFQELETNVSENALNRALSLTESYLDANTSVVVQELQGKLQSQLLVSQQDFQGIQSQLDRELDLALQQGKNAHAIQIQNLQQEFQALEAEKMREWEDARDLANRAWQTDERVGQQDFQRALEFIRLENEKAIMEKDFAYQKELNQQRFDLDFQMQNASMNHDEKIRRLQSGLDEARANNDFIREKQIINLQNKLELNRMDKEFGHDEALMWTDQKIKELLDNNNHENAMELLNTKLNFETQVHKDNLLIENMKIALQQQGLDLEQINTLADLVAQGTLSSSVLVDALQQQFEGLNIELPDENEWQKAMNEDWLMQQYQFALSHGGPGGLKDVALFNEDGNFLGLKPEYAQEFNDYMNINIWGSSDDPIYQAVKNFKDTGDPNLIVNGEEDAIYRYLVNEDKTVPELDYNTFVSGKSKTSTRTNVYRNFPSNGGYFKRNGRVYQVIDRKTDEVGFGDDFKIYTVKDILTGKTATISTRRTANENDSTLSGLGG